MVILVNLDFFHGPVQMKANLNSIAMNGRNCLDLHGDRFPLGTQNVLQCSHQSRGKTLSLQSEGQ